jgi:hypothetical protein
MQVDPIKPKLIAPGTKCLKLKYDEPLSSFAFKIKLRRYSLVCVPPALPAHPHVVAPVAGRHHLTAHILDVFIRRFRV